ncbi:HAD family hydrolase [Roseitranquillus sediminis]|uniref:HAD family hydrolase n=1 Tax=Roseitranquillus sediminis TaxID=2809051 RepID=UPI001D0CA424|nr:HAD family hydrolase [Roseitranquillus sediminis]MBM9593130.1 HAD family hydrolase [Roseitranquillus sediminis]
MRVRGVIFDKDGTLFDLQATWAPCAERLATELSGNDATLEHRLRTVLGYDAATRRLVPDSIMIAETPDRVRDALLAALPAGADRRGLRTLIDDVAARTEQVPTVPLLPLLDELVGRGLLLACVTNDAEDTARLHLQQAGVETRFQAIVGFDSGHGAKPDAAPLLATAARLGLRPHEVVVVGDSVYDMRAGHASGMRCLGVRTGGEEAPLYDLAATVLDDVGGLPGWLDEIGASSSLQTQF